MLITSRPLQATSGTYAGLLNSRDQILGGFLGQLNSFTNTFATEFNKVYASGQGLTGYQTVTSQNAVSSADASLEDAGLPSTPVNGSFQILVQNTTTNQTQAYTINVNLEGLGQDSSLNSVASQINQISGLSALASSSGQLTISNQNADQNFSFANDNSGVLTPLGINTFFTGDSATTLGVNADVANDPSKFAASTGGVAQDSNNATTLAALNDAALPDLNGSSLSDLQNQIISTVTANSAAAQTAATAARPSNKGCKASNNRLAV